VTHVVVSSHHTVRAVRVPKGHGITTVVGLHGRKRASEACGTALEVGEAA